MIPLLFPLWLQYRMVGGFVGLGRTFLARLRWSVMMGLYMAFACAVHQQGWEQMLAVFVLSTLGAFFGRLIPHALFQNGATVPNVLGMALIGILRLGLILAPYAVLNWGDIALYVWDAVWAWDFSASYLLNMTIFDNARMILAGFGIGQGIAYWLGYEVFGYSDSGIYFRKRTQQWRVARAVEGDGPLTPENPQCLDQGAASPTEWAEMLTGMLVYQLAYAVLLVLP